MGTENDQAVLNCIFSPLLPFSSNLEEESEKEDPGTESEYITKIKLEAVRAAENGRTDQATTLLTTALHSSPSASLYNDRAQVLRLAGNVEGALQDLNVAIEMTGGQGKIAGKAFVQRGMIFRVKGDGRAALQDFQKAAELGNDFAKRQLILLNPMAAMCNKILSEMLKRKLVIGEPVE